MLTQARLKELLRYDPETGEFTRVKPIDGTDYLQHRLVWLYIHGRFPLADVDHINGIRSDNRLANLREAARYQNHQNKSMQSNNTSGLIGVSWRSDRNRWVAQIRVLGINRYLGSFVDRSDARAAYLAAKETMHCFQPTPRELLS